MSRFANQTWFLIILLLGLTACGGGKPTTDPALALTQVYQTIEVAQTQTRLAASPTPEISSTPTLSLTPQDTNTPLLTYTLLPGVPSATQFTLSTPGGAQPAACDNAVGISDVTYPDGAEVIAGAPFEKTWRVKNLGPCNWDEDYRLIFGWGGVGTNWDTTPPSRFNVVVLPGETIDISVTLKAPTDPGSYGASFRLQNSKGFNFGPVQTVIVTVK
jgi:hypothetical protein